MVVFDLGEYIDVRLDASEGILYAYGAPTILPHIARYFIFQPLVDKGLALYKCCTLDTVRTRWPGSNENPRSYKGLPSFSSIR